VKVVSLTDHQRFLQAAEGERDEAHSSAFHWHERALAAESKLSSVVEELEGKAIYEYRCAVELADDGVYTAAAKAFARASAFYGALALLRDKGAEQADVNNSCAEPTVGKNSAGNLNSGVAVEVDPGLPDRCPSCDRTEPYGQRVAYCPDPWHEEVPGQQSTTGKKDCER